MAVISTNDQNDFEGRARRKIEVRASRVSQDYTRTHLRLMEADIFPVIGGLDIASITPEQILPLLQSIEGRHGSQQAQQICGLIADVFTAGIVAGVCERNPAIIVRDSLSPRVHKRIPNPLVFDTFTALVTKIGGYCASPITGAALRLSVYLLVMPGELCRAEWNDLHWDEGIWRYQLPVGVKARSGIGVHYVPLSAQAIRIF
jgi:integrase